MLSFLLNYLQNVHKINAQQEGISVRPSRCFVSETIQQISIKFGKTEPKFKSFRMNSILVRVSPVSHEVKPKRIIPVFIGLDFDLLNHT
jgi:hypothetical protein